MYNAPLFSTLSGYRKKGKKPFFMPGHKLGQGIPSLFQMDLTELDETDNLHMPSGVIKEAQDLAADLFGAEDTFFLVNGSTSGIQAMFLSVLRPGDRVIVARNCHLSCISALILTGAVPVFLTPSFIPEAGVYGGVDPAMVEQACQNHPEAKAVYLTSPDYYGFCSDIKTIASIAHQYGKMLLVDEAHGCHFICSPCLPPTALESGADLCVQSAHKTLPALTQSAYLHSRGSVPKEKIQSVLRILLSSSPSYILMAYLDAARSILEQDGKNVYEQIIFQNEKIKALPLDFAEKYLGTHFIQNVDPSRIAVFGNFDGFDFEEVVPEFANGVCSIFLPSFGTREKDFEALYRLFSCKPPRKGQNFQAPFFGEFSISPRDAYFCDKEQVPLRQAAGRICAEVVAPYPPGVPVLIPGEIITKNALGFLSSLHTPVWGIDKTIAVIKR